MEEEEERIMTIGGRPLCNMVKATLQEDGQTNTHLRGIPTCDSGQWESQDWVVGGNQ